MQVLLLPALQSGDEPDDIWPARGRPCGDVADQGTIDVPGCGVVRRRGGAVAREEQVVVVVVDTDCDAVPVGEASLPARERSRYLLSPILFPSEDPAADTAV
jgi:hypothetical protein